MSQLNIDSIRSLGSYFSSLGHESADVAFAFSGFAYSDIVWEKIEKTIREVIPSHYLVAIKRFDTNVGKTTYINTLWNESLSHDLSITDIVLIDSDILFLKEQEYMIDRLCLAIKFIEETKKQAYGIIGFQLAGINNHINTHINQNRKTFVSQLSNLGIVNQLYGDIYLVALLVLVGVYPEIFGMRHEGMIMCEYMDEMMHILGENAFLYDILDNCGTHFVFFIAIKCMT